MHLSFPVFCVIFPDFSSLFKIPWLFPDWKMPSYFSRFSSPSGNHVDATEARTVSKQAVHILLECFLVFWA